MIRRYARIQAGRWVTAALAALVLVACQQSPVTPQADAPLQLDSLRLELAPSGEVLVARGFTHRTMAGSSEVSVPIQISTTAGDTEHSMADWTLCSAPDNSVYLCHQLVFGMRDGHTVAEIAPALDALGMRILTVFALQVGGGMQVLRGTDEAALHALSALQTVAWAEYNRPISVNDPVEYLQQDQVSTTLPVNRSAVRAGNGALEVQPGETVTARYQQPDGSVLTATLHM